MNYSYHGVEQEALDDVTWIQAAVSKIYQTPGRCIDLDTGVLTPSDYTSQIVVETTRDGQTSAIFIFNVANSQSNGTFELTNPNDIIFRSPINFPKAEFGKGFLVYGAAGGATVYLSIDSIWFDSYKVTFEFSALFQMTFNCTF